MQALADAAELPRFQPTIHPMGLEQLAPRTVYRVECSYDELGGEEDLLMLVPWVGGLIG